MSDFLLYLPGTVIVTVCALFLAKRLFHYFQLESYQFQGYKKTVRRVYKRSIIPYLLCGFLLSAINILLWALLFKDTKGSVAALLQTITVCIPVVAFTLWIKKDDRSRVQKKKMVFTARMKRLYGIFGVFILVAQCVFQMVCKIPFLGWGLFIAVLPLLCAISGAIAIPLEKSIFRMYFNDAKKKLLQNPKLIRIGITGSYGKTSTKFILAEILSQKYNVLFTPSSFNTPMGVTRIVRERLQPSHQVFIGEMGARHVGEIKELSNLVHPHIGILTSVGPQHLDTFKTIERIRDTKYELIEALPKDGFAVFSDDDAIVTDLYRKTTSPRSVLAGGKNSPVRAENVRVSAQGSSFTLIIDGVQPIECETELLGEHNIRNIIVSAAVAHHLGLTPTQIRRGISRLKPVEHRLQLLKNPGDITVIDDAFNTNPRSSLEALKVLSMFPERRILVTPGMVELGKDEEMYNREFGKNICGKADIVFLVGKVHTAPIYEGLKDGGFDENMIHVFSNLNEAIGAMRQLLKPGDTVMYENDLPDNYSQN